MEEKKNGELTALLAELPPDIEKLKKSCFLYYGYNLQNWSSVIYYQRKQKGRMPGKEITMLSVRSLVRFYSECYHVSCDFCEDDILLRSYRNKQKHTDDIEKPLNG